MHLCMGTSLRGLGQLEESQKYLNRAIEGLKHRLQITPKAPDVLSNLGMALASTGNIAEAKIYLERAVKAAPSNPDYHFMLITILIDQKDYEQAQTAITNAINAMKQGGNTEAVSRLQRIAEQAATRQSQTKQ
jgi:tetratricopeptide (TPR) repeat protein